MGMFIHGDRLTDFDPDEPVDQEQNQQAALERGLTWNHAQEMWVDRRGNPALTRSGRAFYEDDNS